MLSGAHEASAEAGSGSVRTVKIVDSFRLLWTAEVDLAEAWNSVSEGRSFPDATFAFEHMERPVMVLRRMWWRDPVAYGSQE